MALVNMNIFKFSNAYLALAVSLMLLSVGSIIVLGLTLGIDFTGGSIMEVQYTESRPSAKDLQALLVGLELGSLQIQPVGEQNVLVRMKDIEENVHQEVLTKLGTGVQELRFESIGPVIGRELTEKTFLITVLSLLVLVSYIAFAFRKVTHPVRPWHWPLASLLALVFDLLVPLGVFAFFGKLESMELSIPVVVALLTVLGYSINNNIVVFDRVRENVFKNRGLGMHDVMNISITQTLSRNLNTSLCTLFPVLAIFFFGGETLRAFSLVLGVGIVAGLYSSILLSPPFLLKMFDKRL
jgi:preprotein translocase subunit SecF